MAGLFVLVLCSIIILALISRVIESFQVIGHHIPIFKERTIVGYKKKFRIMNSSEASLFFELKKQLPNGMYVFPNMRMADVLDTVSGKGYYESLDKIWRKHVDFVICNQDFEPLAVIELNGGYHKRPKQMLNDKMKKDIFLSVQMPFFVIKTGDDFNAEVSNIMMRVFTPSIS